MNSIQIKDIPITCSNCLLDSSDDPKIEFDSEGVCNYCNNYYLKYIKNWPKKEELDSLFQSKLRKVKESNPNRHYNCILGVSGGVDSTFLALKAKEWGLNPLLVHFDNGWNSELAVINIQNIIDKTGFDLFTYVVDWEEFRDLQLSYIKASVLDWEIPTDHGFFAMLFNQAFKQKIKYILTGHNHQTEAILPKTMRWSKMDVANIRDIHKKFGNKKLKTFPILPFFKFIYYQNIRKFEMINFLDLINYDKEKAKKIITEKLDWKDYGGKHYESIFTRFYQGYILNKKFGYDKRKAHLSNLICSGQITKKEAVSLINEPAYNSNQLLEDKEYVIKKLGLSTDEFEVLMKKPICDHTDYKSYETGLYLKHQNFMKRIKPISSLLKKLVK